MTKPYEDEDIYSVAYAHYEAAQAEMQAMWEEAWDAWSCRVRVVQKNLEYRGWTEEEAYECALYECGPGPKELD